MGLSNAFRPYLFQKYDVIIINGVTFEVQNNYLCGFNNKLVLKEISKNKVKPTIYETNLTQRK